MSPIEFKAPWSRSLKIATVATSVLLGLIAIFGVFVLTDREIVAKAAIIGLPILILLGALPFVVLGYSLTQDEIQIKRLGWRTSLPLATLNAVEGKADAMRKSIRIFGNGGMFAYTGLFWNRQLKFYRAFATDPSRAVILRYPKRTMVITPHDPQQFIMRARTLIKTNAFRA